MFCKTPELDIVLNSLIQVLLISYTNNFLFFLRIP